MSEAASTNDEWMPLYLSCIAGASTCLGAAVVFCHPKQDGKNRIVNPNTMSFSLALAGSVMATVSVISIGPECLQAPGNTTDSFQMMPIWSITFLQRILFFGLGCLLYFILSYFAFPEPDAVLGLTNDEAETVDDEPEQHAIQLSKPKVEQHKENVRSRRSRSLVLSSSDSGDQSLDGEDGADTGDILEEQPLFVPEIIITALSWSQWSAGADLHKGQKRAWRVAMLLFVSLLCHNFPEGLAVAASALESKSLGITVTIGIMIHNIPEGIAIAIPCLAARPDCPWLSFALASASGLAEPLGALVALLCLRNVPHDDTALLNMENVLAFVAGVMIMVAVWELFPEARLHARQGNPFYFVAGIVIGIVIMTATDLCLP